MSGNKSKAFAEVPEESYEYVQGAVKKQVTRTTPVFVGDPEKKAYVQYPGQQPIQIKESDLQKAVDGGARLSSPEEFEQAARNINDQKYGGVIPKIISGLSGAADAATLGLGTGIIGKTMDLAGLDEDKENLRRYIKWNPKTYLLGMVAPAIGKAVLTGGASAAGDLSVAAAKAGVAGAESSIAGSVGRLAAKGVLQTVVQDATRGAATMGAFGMGSEWSKEVLENQDLSAQKILASGAMGALFGAVGEPIIAGGLRAVGKGLETMSAKSAERATMEAAERSAVEAGAQNAQKHTERMVAAVNELENSGLSPQEIRPVLKEMSAKGGAYESKAIQQLYDQNRFGQQSFEETLEPLAKDLTAKTDEFYKATRENIAIKGKEYERIIEENVSPHNKPAAIEALKDTVAKARQDIQETLQQPLMEGQGRGKLRTLNRYLEGVEKEFADEVAMENMSSADVFRKLREIKTAAQELSSWGRSSLEASATVKKLTMQLGRDIERGQVVPLLENTEIFGKMGEIEKQINAAMTERSRAEDMFKGLTRVTDVGASGKIRGVDVNDVISLLRKPDAAGKEPVINALSRFLEATKTEHDVLSRYGYAPAERGIEAVERLETLKDSWTKAIDQARVAQTIRDMRGKEAVQGTLEKYFQTLRYGAPMFGPAGMGIYAADFTYKLAKKPLFRAEMAAKFDKLLETATGGLIKNKRTYVVQPNTAEINAKTRALFEGMSSPERMDAIGQKIARDAGPMADSIQAAFNRAVQHLQKAIPTHSPVLTAMPEQKKMDPLQAHRLAKQVEVITDPTSVVRDLGNFTLTKDQVLTLKTVYPELYEHMREQLMNTVGKDVTKLSYAARIKLGYLFDAPLDPHMTKLGQMEQMRQATSESAGPPAAMKKPPAGPKVSPGGVSRIQKDKYNSILTSSEKDEGEVE